ncbi:MAG: asparagine synthase-related protein [Anaerolineae bacterium]
MTGLFGAVHFDDTPVVRPSLQRMQDFLAPIGPDSQDLFVSSDASAALGRTLYRVTHFDKHDHQPITLQGVTAVAEARLDGRTTLADELRSVGGAAGADLHDVHAISDAELVLRAYLAWGEDAPLHLLGDYAAAIWDAPRRRIVLFCDPLAIYTLAYSYTDHPQLGHVFAFSNRLMALLRYPTVDLSLNESAIGDYLMSATVSLANRAQTIFEHVFILEPGTLLIYDGKEINKRTYWHMIEDPMIRHRTEADYVEEFKYLLWQAVEDRLQADHTLISMSGGLDSPSIAAVALDLVRRGKVNTTLDAVVSVFDRIHPDNDEAYYAGLVASKLKIPTDFRSKDNLRLKDPLPVTSQPGFVVELDSGEYTQQKFGGNRFIGVTGDGADELLRETPLWKTLMKLPPGESLDVFLWLWRFRGRRPPLNINRRELKRGVRNALTFKKAPPLIDQFPLPGWLNSEFAQQQGLYKRWDSFLNTTREIGRHLQPETYNAFAFNEFGKLVGTMHPAQNPPAVWVQPYLDLRLLRYALALPPQVFNPRKRLVRLAMVDMLPEEVLARNKEILGAYTYSLLRLPDSQWIDEWEPIPELSRYINRGAVPKITGENATKTISTLTNLIPVVFNNWLKHFRELEQILVQERSADLKSALG